MEKRLMTICLVAVVLFLCGSAGAQTTYYVDDDATGENNGSSWEDAYTIIQDGIDAASEGDTVQVAAGLYEENITLKSGVAVIGAGASSTIIDGGEAGSVVTAFECGPDTVLEGFTIKNGYAENGGGMYNEDSNTTITSCTFSDNTASNWGSGMYNLRSSSTVTNCTFTGNSATWHGGGMCNYLSYSPTVTNCMFSGNTAWAGGGMYNAYSDTIVTDCEFTGNTAYRGGGMFNSLSYIPATVTNCTFTGNSAEGTGGGMHNYNELSPTTVTNCTFIGNTAAGYYGGGGMVNEGDSAIVTNCEFSGNSANTGGGMSNWGYGGNQVEATVTNCTFSGNTAVNFGGGMYNHQHTRPIITNCIMWGNTAAEGNEISNTGDLTTPLISYSNIAGCGGEWTGVGPLGLDRGNNMDEDPLFVSAPSDLRLLFGSPCIDAGDNTAVPTEVTTDLDGNPRITNDVVDMGAYEYCEYEPEIDVIPLAWDFGDVELGASSSVIVTIDNTGNGDLTVDGLGFATGSDPEIELLSPPTLPLVIAPEDSVDIEVVFTPSSDEECYLAGLEISSDDADEGVVTVNLSGCGVPVEIPPSEQIEAIIALIEGGDVAGTGGQPDKKIEVLVNMVEAVGDLIAAEDLEKACQQLSIVLQKCDGESPPADFVQDVVEGATEELEGMIEELMEDLGC